MKCKECKKYYAFKNETEGVCGLPESYTPTTEETDCPFIEQSAVHCGDCTHYQVDDACRWQRAEDEVCDAFQHIAEQQIENALFVLLKCRQYKKETIVKICEDFEKSDIVQFVCQHQEDLKKAAPHPEEE